MHVPVEAVVVDDVLHVAGEVPDRVVLKEAGLKESER